jgi:hypothetical protein
MSIPKALEDLDDLVYVGYPMSLVCDLPIMQGFRIPAR